MSEIEVRHLSKTFTQKDLKVDALSDINLTVEKGDIYGLIGMSGAGKSTLVRCLNFLEKPTEGQVFIEGRELGSMDEKQLRKQRRGVKLALGAIVAEYGVRSCQLRQRPRFATVTMQGACPAKAIIPPIQPVSRCRGGARWTST